MSAALILQFVLAALQIAPTVITDIEGFRAWAAQTSSALKAMQAENRDPSPAEWAALNAGLLAALEALSSAKPAAPAPLMPEPSAPPTGESPEQLDQAAVGS